MVTNLVYFAIRVPPYFESTMSEPLCPVHRGLTLPLHYGWEMKAYISHIEALHFSRNCFTVQAQQISCYDQSVNPPDL